MENKKVKIALPKNCEVEKTEISVEDNFIMETIKGYKEFDKDLKCKEVNK